MRSCNDCLEKCCWASLNTSLSWSYTLQDTAVSPSIFFTALLSFLLQALAQILSFHGDHLLLVFVAPASTTRLGLMSEIYAQYIFFTPTRCWATETILRKPFILLGFLKSEMLCEQLKPINKYEVGKIYSRRNVLYSLVAFLSV